MGSAWPRRWASAFIRRRRSMATGSGTRAARSRTGETLGGPHLDCPINHARPLGI